MLSHRALSIGESRTIGISTRVKALAQAGVDVTNLSIGEPDFDTPQAIKDAGIKAINENKTKYDNPSGVLALKTAIINKLKEENNLSYTQEEIIVSSGAKHAITNALMAIMDPGDEIIVPIPYWTSYPEIVKLLGGHPILAQTQASNDFKLQGHELQAMITPATKAVFICNPSNPTGAVYSPKELESLVAVCLTHGIYILADEIYEQIIYTKDFTSVASISDASKAITITINGLSKSAAMTGWRLGYTASHKTLAKAMASIQGHMVSHPSTLSQWAGVKALTACQDEKKNMVNIYSHRRDQVLKRFLSMPELPIIHPQGAFYIFIDISALKKHFKDTQDLSLEVCNTLLDDYKLALVPGSAFGLKNYMRMTFAASLDQVMVGMDKLQQFLKDLQL